MQPIFIILFSNLIALTLGGAYSVSDTISGSTFFDFFEFVTSADSVHGRVNYVDQPTAIAQNLTFAGKTSSIIRADFKTVLDPNGSGRNSVKLRSKKLYTTHVAMFDIRHMPQGCGTWPAIWENTGSRWPNGGEIDIVEGINDQSPNLATLHTNEGCTMPTSRDQTGTPNQNNCDQRVNWNTGCGVKFPTANSYGPPFNKNGGGWYALERAPHDIKVFFWPRDSGFVPDDVRDRGETINTDNWGTPAAHFPDKSCNMAQHFDDHTLIINLTFCGDWAGSHYAESGCPSTCVDFVNNNPSAFADAYFEFASIRIYE